MLDLKAVRWFYDGKKKVSHDYDGENITTFSYRDLMGRGIPHIGIPAKPNRLIIIDVDVPGETHQHDGRAWWTKFATDKGISPTYTVRTASGGYHFYFKIPDWINPDTFAPPARLSDGVDVKWNGWVGAPPSPGYSIEYGNVSMISEAPKELIDEMHRVKNGQALHYEVGYEEGMQLDLHKPFTEVQLKDLKAKLKWFQTNGDISYPEWRDGIFALKAGVDDPELLAEMVDMWTYNRSYQPGDEHKAQEILERANKYGGVGPGTIFSLIKQAAMRQGATAPEVQLSPQEVLDRSGVNISVKEDGSLSCAVSESNVAAILGSMYSADQLYHDSRFDLYVYKGEVVSDKELVNILCPMIQSRKYGLGLEKIRKSVVLGGLEVLMTARKRDPHVQWLKNLKWDGVPRIDKFFPEYVGSDDTEYTRAVSKNFWIALVARALSPGCKFDNVIVLEGKEGIRKSSLIEAIGGEYTFAPSNRKSLEDMDDLRKMHQSILVELPELMGLVGEDSNKVKAFLSKSHDSIRGLYERTAIKKPRGFIFVGTTNDAKYLNINMGARRFWPIQITRNGNIDINRVEMDREQLFAEALQRFQNREKFYEVPKEHLDDLIKSRISIDPLVRPIDLFTEGLHEVDITDIYSRLVAMQYLPRGLTVKASQKIEESLKYLGFKEIADGKWIRNVGDTLPADFKKFSNPVNVFI